MYLVGGAHSFFKSFLKINLFIFALHGLFLVAESQGFSLFAVYRLLIVMVSLVGFGRAGFSCSGTRAYLP